MCEILSMSTACEATISLSLNEFAQHGGVTGDHTDGWGVGYYSDFDVQLFRGIEAASDSKCLELIHSVGVKSRLVAAHIRKATQGDICVKNTQPFVREIFGRKHLFSHNGDLKGLSKVIEGDELFYRPVGTTDSEKAFCYLASRMRKVWMEKTPILQDRILIVEEVISQLKPLGPFNFVYSDGEYLYAYGHKRTQPGKEGFHPPGLHYLTRKCTGEVHETKMIGFKMSGFIEPQKVVLIASTPLSDEGWRPFGEGELIVAHRGEVVFSKTS